MLIINPRTYQALARLTSNGPAPTHPPLDGALKVAPSSKIPVGYCKDTEHEDWGEITIKEWAAREEADWQKRM
jgi:hypothetical protein